MDLMLEITTLIDPPCGKPAPPRPRCPIFGSNAAARRHRSHQINLTADPLGMANLEHRKTLSEDENPFLDHEQSILDKV
jgi:hypothetical protein